MHCVILAGGTGTRFWPRSRKEHPKQLLQFTKNSSLIAQTVKRLSKYTACEEIYLVASESLAAKCHELLPELKAENFIIEPSGRNTAPAIALAAFTLRKRHGDVVMGVFPADHLISKEKEFYRALDNATEKAVEGANLVTLGIQPSYPATGYGYVEFERGEAGNLHRVIRFTEKPDRETARTFLEGGAHLWNGGMFVWKVSTILERLAENLPATYEHLTAVEHTIDTPEYRLALDKVWEQVDRISIDYGVLENAVDIYAAETAFVWKDLGSWRTLFDVLPKDSAGNAVQGDAAVIDASNSLIISEGGGFTAVIGVQDIVVINTGDATLVLPRSESERVQEIVHWLKTRKRDELL